MATTSTTLVLTDQDDIRRAVTDACGDVWKQANLEALAADYEARYAQTEASEAHAAQQARRMGQGFYCANRSALDNCGTCEHCTQSGATSAISHYAFIAPRLYGKAARIRTDVQNRMARY